MYVAGLSNVKMGCPAAMAQRRHIRYEPKDLGAACHHERCDRPPAVFAITNSRSTGLHVERLAGHNRNSDARVSPGQHADFVCQSATTLYVGSAQRHDDDARSL